MATRNLRDAIIDAANVLGNPGASCPACKCDGCDFEMREATAILYHALGIDVRSPSAYEQFSEIRDGRMPSRVVSVRMPSGEAEALIRFSRARGVPVSKVLREAWWAKASAESRPLEEEAREHES